MTDAEMSVVVKVLDILSSEQMKNQKLLDETDLEARNYCGMDVYERRMHDKKFYNVQGRHEQLGDIIYAVKSAFFGKEFK